VAPIFQSETATLEKHSAKSKMSNKMSAENKANEIDFTICKIILKKGNNLSRKLHQPEFTSTCIFFCLMTCPLFRANLVSLTGPLIFVEQTKVYIIVALVGGERLKITDGPASRRFHFTANLIQTMQQ
jgi:hypothetical protein